MLAKHILCSPRNDRRVHKKSQISTPIDSSESFDNVLHKEMPHKLTKHYHNTLPCSSLNVVNYGYSEAYETNESALQSSAITNAIFLLYFNDLTKTILRSLVNIYADNK